MKAITLHQPWATLIALGVKNIGLCGPTCEGRARG